MGLFDWKRYGSWSHVFEANALDFSRTTKTYLVAGPYKLHNRVCNKKLQSSPVCALGATTTCQIQHRGSLALKYHPVPQLAWGCGVLAVLSVGGVGDSAAYHSGFASGWISFGDAGILKFGPQAPPSIALEFDLNCVSSF